MLIASTKIPEREVSISPSSFYGYLPAARLLPTGYVVLSSHWMKEMRCEFSSLPGISVKIWNSED